MIKPVTSTPPSSAQQGDSSANDVSSNGTFGAVLARQVQEKATATPASKNAPATNATENQASQAAIAQIDPEAAIAPNAASLTIAALGKKEIKFPVAAAKEASSKTHREPALATPDASGMVPMVYPEIRVTTDTPSAAVTSVDPITASKVSDSMAYANSIPGINAQVAAGVSAKITDGTNPKLADGVSPKVADGANLKLAAGIAAEGSKAADLSNASAADPKTASATADFSKLVQAATDNAAATIKPVLEAKTASVQPEQLASVQAMINPLSANPDTHTISAPLGSSTWAGEFSQKISWLSHQQSQVAELHLNPPDLGPMHVVISVTDNQATAQFSSPHSEVRHAIENALPKLRESLADNGIMLGNATVSDQTPRDSGARNFTQPNNRTGVINTAEPAAISVPIVPTRRRHTGMLDTFA